MSNTFDLDSPTKLANTCCYRDIRAENIIHLGSQITNYSVPDVVSEMFEAHYETIWAALGFEEPEEEFDEDDWELLAELCHNHNKLGWLIQFATPTPITFHENGFTSSGWGMYHTFFIYDDNFENAVKRALEYQENWLSEQRKKWEQENVQPS